MVRHYTMKGFKRKKGHEKYDKEEEVKEEVQEVQSTETAKKVKLEATIQSDEDEAEEALAAKVHDMEGIPIAPTDANGKKPGVIFVLEKASLEVAKVGKVYIMTFFFMCIQATS